MAQAAPLSYEMPETRAVIAPGLPATPSKLGSKYFIKATGGTPPYSIAISGDAIRVGPRRGTVDAFDITPLKAGEANLILKDSKGGSVTAKFTVAAEAAIAPLKASLSDAVLAIGKPLTLTVNGGTPPYRVDFVQPVRYKVERLAEGSYRLTGLTAGGGEIRISDQKGNTTGATLSPAPFAMSIAKKELKAGEESVLELQGGTAPYQFNAQQHADVLAIQMVAENKYRLLAKEGGTRSLTAEDAQRQTAQVQVSIQGRPVDVSTQPLTVKIAPQKIHLSPQALPPNSAELMVTGGKPPYKLELGTLLQAETQGDSKFKIRGKGSKALNVPISVTDSEGRKGSTLIHLVPIFSYDCRLPPIKVGSAGTIKITGGEPHFQINGADPKIVRITQNRQGGLSGPRPGEPIETITVQGLAPGSVRLSLNDLNNMYVAHCPVTVVP